MTSRTPRSSQESEDWTLGLSEPDGAPSASLRLTPTPAPSSPSDGWESRMPEISSPLLATDIRASLGHHGYSSPRGDGSDTLLVQASGPAASPARTSPSLASGQGSPESAAASPSPSLTLWSATDLPPSSSRMYRDSSPVMEARTLGRSSVAWANSGMGGPTGFSTLSSSECPSADDGCSFVPSTLAQVLEPTAPQRFYLSARAATGILRRATMRGRELPASLQTALEALAQSSPPSDTTAGPSEPKALTGDTSSSVRRLTPVECERLMGWPDGWTIVKSWPRSSRAAVDSEPPTSIRRSSTASQPASAHLEPTSDGSMTDSPTPLITSTLETSVPPTQSFAEMIDSMPLEKLEDWEDFSPSASTPTATDAAGTES
jgi:hypothetical protein